MAIELDGIDPPRRRISCVLPIQQRQGDVVTIAPFSRRVQQCRHDSLSAATGKRIDDEERLFLQCGHLFGEPGAYTILLTHDLGRRSEEHTSELKSLMRISYAVFCLKKKKDTTLQNKQTTSQNT